MKKTLSMLALMSAVLVSCTKPEDPASISVSPTELNFDATGGDKTVTITSTGEWSVAYTSEGWFELSATSGQNGDKITITVDPYDNTEDERSAYIEFCCGNSSASVSIIQSAKEHSVTVTPTEIKTEAEGGKYEIAVTSTDEWTVTADNWIRLSADKGNNGDIVTLSIDYNETAGERTGTVTFDCKGKTATVTVTQQPDNSPIIQFKDPYFLDALLETYTVSWNGESYRVDVDKNNDGQISENEAASVEVLDLSKAQKQAGNDIRNIDELKYFTELRYLYFVNCSIENLTFSNPKLEELDLEAEVFTGSSGNIISLNVNECTSLKTLNCSSNQLTSLDVSNNTALTDLVCDYNQLTSLDLSKNTALTDLSCRGNQLTGNQLTSLDVSNNTALTDLSCEGNQLTSLDVSNNTALTYLSCQNNQLTSLDVSNNTALTYLSCFNNQLTSLDVSKNTALTDLVCDYNQLTSLDVSKNTALTDFWCSYNQLTSLDLSKNTALTDLNCKANNINILDLHNNQKLCHIYCSGNPLQKLILYSYHIIADSCIEDIESEYGEIIEYME